MRTTTPVKFALALAGWRQRSLPRSSSVLLVLAGVLSRHPSGRKLAEIADVKVNMPDGRPRRHSRPRRIARDAHQVPHVERLRHHRQLPVPVPPHCARPIRVHLDALLARLVHELTARRGREPAPARRGRPAAPALAVGGRATRLRGR